MPQILIFQLSISVTVERGRGRGIITVQDSRAWACRRRDAAHLRAFLPRPRHSGDTSRRLLAALGRPLHLHKIVDRHGVRIEGAKGAQDQETLSFSIVLLLADGGKRSSFHGKALRLFSSCGRWDQ